MIAPIKWRKIGQSFHQCKSIVFNALRQAVDKVELFYHNTYGKFIFLYICIYRVMEIDVHFFHHYWLTPYRARS